MSTPTCLRCLKRSFRSIDKAEHLPITQRAAFSSTPTHNAVQKKVVAKPTAKAGRTLVLAKRQRQVTQRPPAPGERKALRKRIVLSNTNALEVQGLQDLTGDKLSRNEGGGIALEEFAGRVLGFNNNTVDGLRALEAFRPTQGWSLFRRPASLVRQETVQLARDMDKAVSEKRVTSKVIFGDAQSGKSVLLLQAQAMAFVKGWIVLHFPEAQDLTNAHTSYQPITQIGETIYIQPHYTAKLLANFASANQKILEKLRLSQQHQLPIPIQPNISLSRFVDLGAKDPELAWPIWQALWSELTAPSQSEGDGLKRPPVLISMDGVDKAMRMCAYLDREAKPIHAHELGLIKQFCGYLSGDVKLANGGMVIAATCGSNRAAAPTLDWCLKYKHVSQHNSEGSTGDQAGKALPLPQWDPYVVKDARVEAALKDVEAVKLRGLTKDEARGVMEYYAQSGLFREAVTDGMVSEKWTLAGPGIIGQLEKASVRARF